MDEHKTEVTQDVCHLPSHFSKLSWSASHPDDSSDDDEKQNVQLATVEEKHEEFPESHNSPLSFPLPASLPSGDLYVPGPLADGEWLDPVSQQLGSLPSPADGREDLNRSDFGTRDHGTLSAAATTQRSANGKLMSDIDGLAELPHSHLQETTVHHTQQPSIHASEHTMGAGCQQAANPEAAAAAITISSTAPKCKPPLSDLSENFPKFRAKGAGLARLGQANEFSMNHSTTMATISEEVTNSSGPSRIPHCDMARHTPRDKDFAAVTPQSAMPRISSKEQDLATMNKVNSKHNSPSHTDSPSHDRPTSTSPKLRPRSGIEASGTEQQNVGNEMDKLQKLSRDSSSTSEKDASVGRAISPRRQGGGSTLSRVMSIGAQSQITRQAVAAAGLLRKTPSLETGRSQMGKAAIPPPSCPFSQMVRAMEAGADSLPSSDLDNHDPAYPSHMAPSNGLVRPGVDPEMHSPIGQARRASTDSREEKADAFRPSIPAHATEETHSVMSRQDHYIRDSVRSGLGEAGGLHHIPRTSSFRSRAGAQSVRSGTSGTNITGMGGTYHNRRNRRKRGPRKKRAPPVNMPEWRQCGKQLRNCWSELMEKATYSEIGVTIYTHLCQYESLEPLFRFTDVAVQGTKFVDMLSSIVDNMDSPTAIYQRMADLAPLHHRLGVKGSQMPLMLEVILRVLHAVMGKSFKCEYEKAWVWIWAYLTKCMELSLEEVGSTLGVVRDSWDIIMEKYTCEEVGVAIYDYLFRVVPHVQNIFSKPRQYMATKMGAALELLISLVDDPDHMKQQLTWLGLRHVQYGVRPHHIPLMGPALISSFADAAGDSWSDEYEKAWLTVWNMVCDTMSESIKEGEDYGFSAQHLVSLLEERILKQNVGLVGKFLKLQLQDSHPDLVEALTSEDEASVMRKTFHSSAEDDLEGTEEVVIQTNGLKQEGNSGESPMSPGRTAMSFASSSPTSKHHSSVFGHILSGENNAKKIGRGNRSNTLMTSGTNLATIGMTKARTIKLGSLKSQDPDERLGSNVWSLIKVVAENIWEPEKQLEATYVFAFKNYYRGMRGDHLKVLGDAMEQVLKNILEDQGDWGEHAANSWRWMWRIINEGLSKEFDALESDQNGLVLDAWGKVKRTVEFEDLGKKFWNQLNNEAPEQTHLFHRKLKRWGHLLHHIMEVLMKSLTDPETFFENLFELTLRHIQWGVRGDYLTPFGRAVMYTLEECLGEDWNEQVENAWKAVWKRAATSMARGLNVGGNAITHALVQGDVEALQTSVSYAPRSKRSEWLCEIEINGAIITPLYWALRDGKFAIAEFILQDLLTIRADMHDYYYAADLLFEKHADLVGELGRECPSLLETLLDGLLWHSKEKLLGHQVRVNYYIKDLYGDPDLYVDPWTSPLARMVNIGENKIFKHPAIIKCLELKWSSFGLSIFCLKESWYLLLLLLFTFAHTTDPRGCEDYVLLMRIALKVQAALTVFIVCVITGLQYSKRQCVFRKFGSVTFMLPRHLSHFWDIVRLLSCFVILLADDSSNCDSGDFCDPLSILYNATNCTQTGEITASESIRRMSIMWLRAAKAKEKSDDQTDLSEDSPLSHQFDRAPLAIVAVMLWCQLFQAAILSTPMAAFTYTIGKMFADLSHSLFMIVVLLFAFGSALNITQAPPFDEGLDQSLVVLLQEVLGLSQPAFTEITPFARTLIIVFLTLVMVVMLNILIAQLTITYEAVNSDKQGFALRHRTSTCLDMEAFAPLRWRRQVFCDLGFHLPLPFSRSEEGPAGGIQVLEPENTAKYVPDRILRFTGEASPSDPWPTMPGQDAYTDLDA